jgi:thiamine biosynthesis protein ThiC
MNENEVDSAKRTYGWYSLHKICLYGNSLNQHALSKKDREEGLANAKLIAAAPSLLKQVKRMYDLAEMMGMKMLSEEWDEQFRAVYNQVMQNAEFLYSEQGININE